MTKPHLYPFILSLLGFLLAGAHGVAHGACGQITTSAFGPLDYTDYNGRQKVMSVDRVHFTPKIEALEGGTRSVAGDLSYTLNVTPNHHRALDAISRLAVREGTEHPIGSDHSVSCWFQRAVVFKPRDTMVRMLYATHLERTGRIDEAIQNLEIALRMRPDDARILYNLGSLHFSKGEFENALHYAKQAYAAGHTATTLRDDLMRLGHWDGDE